MLNLDRTGKVDIDYWWIYTGGADGARSLLGSVAGSMISVAATAFSITIVALQLAASNFRRDFCVILCRIQVIKLY